MDEKVVTVNDEYFLTDLAPADMTAMVKSYKTMLFAAVHTFT